jgi:Tfp pilus assembly protein PilF
LKPFRARVTASARKDFEAGITFLKAGDYPKAEASLKRAIRPDADSMAAMAYLAATFAASGHDQEASAVWQTALIDGNSFPQIYDWLAQALIRSRQLGEAREILEEAIGKWPSDPRFTWPLATVYAAQGEGSDALSILERYLVARPNDRDALESGLEWIYQAHASGRILHGEAEDLRLARAYADTYTKSGGPHSALVRRWMEFLEHERR